MYRERTFTVKLADGFTHIFLTDMNRRASGPDSAGVCKVHETERQFGETHGQKLLKGGSMKVGTACPAFFCSHDGDLNGLCQGDDFGEVARRKHLQTFGKIFEKGLEVKQTGNIGLSASNAKVLKILNRAIKIDMLNDEMTLEADTKLVEDALETMKLIGAKRRRFATCQEELRANNTNREFQEVHISGVDFVPQLGDDVGVCCSRQN